jgi:hypothetical protein
VICELKHWDYLLKYTQYPILVIINHANLIYYCHSYKIGQWVAGYITEYEQYNIQLAYWPGAFNRADTLSWQPDYASDPYNDELVIMLPEHLFIPPNTPVIELQTCPFHTWIICLDATGLTNDNNDNPQNHNDLMQICSINDDNINTDIKMETPPRSTKEPPTVRKLACPV